MKSPKRKVFGLLTVIALTGILSGCLLTGCAWFKSTGPVDTTYKVEGTLIPTVNVLVEGWGEWVKAGKPTQAQADAVKAAYGKYFNAQTTMSNAVERFMTTTSTNSNAKLDLDAAEAAVDATKASVIQLITTFKK